MTITLVTHSYVRMVLENRFHMQLVVRSPGYSRVN
jgi:hypothetical protein